MTNKITILFLLSYEIQILLAITCNNPLKYVFNIDAFNTSQVVSEINVCKSLQNKDVCCPKEYFDSIQNKTDALISNLRDGVGARDLALTDARLNIVPEFTLSLARITSALQKMSGTSPVNLESLSYSMGTLGQTNTNLNDVNLNRYIEMWMYLVGLSNLSYKILSLKEDFMNYQKARTKCIIAMVKLQAATWCLACDPNYSRKGVSIYGASITVQMSNSTQKKIENACYDYFSEAYQQDNIINLKFLAPIIRGLASAVEKISISDSSGVKDFLSLVQKLETLPFPTKTSEEPAWPPFMCTTNHSQCSILWDMIYYGGKIKINPIVNGGVLISSSNIKFFSNTGSRLLKENTTERFLQSEWDFDEDEAGVIVTFEDDPSNADNMSMTGGSSLIKENITCIVILVIFFIF